MNLLPEFLSEKLHVNLTAIFIWMVRALAIVGTIAFGIIIYGEYFEQPLLRYQNLPFPVEEPVEQGRSIPVVVERCNDSKEETIYLSTRQLRMVDSDKVILLPNQSVGITPGCHRGTARSAIVPIETPPGYYVLEGEAQVRGLLKTHKIEWYTETFQVIPQSKLTQELSDKNDMDAYYQRAKPKR